MDITMRRDIVHELSVLGFTAIEISSMLHTTVTTIRNDQAWHVYGGWAPGRRTRFTFQSALKKFYEIYKLPEKNSREDLLESLLYDYLCIGEVFVYIQALADMMVHMIRPPVIPELEIFYELFEDMFGINLTYAFYTNRKVKSIFYDSLFEVYPESIPETQEELLSMLRSFVYASEVSFLQPLWLVQDVDADNVYEIVASHVEGLLSTIDPVGSHILQLRYGLFGNECHTLIEIGNVMNITKECVRQHESRAIQEMSHPGRSGQLLKLFRPQGVDISEILFKKSEAQSAYNSWMLTQALDPQTDIHSLGLSVRLSNGLASVGVITIAEAQQKTAKELLGIKNFGRKTLDELRAFFDRYKLSHRLDT